METTPFWKRLYWENILFLVLTHALGTGAVWYLAAVRFSWLTVGLAVLMLVLCALSISGGYHRLFAHRAYQCSNVVRLFHLFFGAASWQASALQWASDHRNHHAYTDEDQDPYNIKKGFWWAHWGWLCHRPTLDYKNAKDLIANRLMVLQDRHYLSLALAVGFLLPMAIATAWDDAIGGLLVAGWLRLLIQYHATFCINSVAHMFGRQPYSTATSARDSTLAAILTMGEGYHNYHHRFPSDYRNGVRSYQYDPSKWVIWMLSKIGLAWDLNKAGPEAIEKACQSVRSARNEKRPAGVAVVEVRDGERPYDTEPRIVRP